MASIEPTTIRSLCDEIYAESDSCLVTAESLSNFLFGPSPREEPAGKDPRSDLKSTLERCFARVHALNEELMRINNGLGMPSRSFIGGNALQERAIR